ncbi:MAG: alpha/beta hydrolase [Micrococcaceae bacterium]
MVDNMNPDFDAVYEREEFQRTFKYRGSKTYYWDYHAVDALKRTDQTLIFVHGFRGDHHGLIKIVTELPQYRIIVPDLPGFGISARLPEEQNVDGYAHYLNEFIDSLNLDKTPVIVGHSFGSVVSAKYAVDYPDKLAKLVLLNPIAEATNKGIKGLFTKGSVGLFNLSTKAPEVVSDVIMKNPIMVRGLSIFMAKTKDKELRKEIHAEHDEHFSAFTDKDGLVEAFRASVNSSISDFGYKIKTPTLLVAGDKDDIAPLQTQISLQYTIKDSQLKVIKNVGHLIHYEKADEAAKAIDSFVR